MIDEQYSGSAGLPASLEAWRVSDAQSARAYEKTGDKARAHLKTCISGIFSACAPSGAASTVLAARYHDGSSRIEERAPKPWFALAVEPGICAPAQVIAAVLPAIALRMPCVLAARPTGLGKNAGRAARAWPHALLTALELCGVENVCNPPAKAFWAGLQELHGEYGPGGLACLGSHGFAERLRAKAQEFAAVWRLAPPGFIGLLEAPGVTWDREAMATAHAGVAIRTLDVAADNSGSVSSPHQASVFGEERTLGPVCDADSSWAVFAPASAAPPPWARLVLEPGREVLWDWPDMPRELFISRRLVYS